MEDKRVVPFGSLGHDKEKVQIMAANLPKSDVTIAGYTLGEVRKVLKYFARHGRSADISDRADLVPDKLEAAILKSELVDWGLLSLTGKPDNKSFPALTEAGRALAMSNARRFARSVVDRVREQLLDRAELLNADPRQIYRIKKLWVFGSVIREDETVGDFDVVIEYEIRPGLKWSSPEARALTEVMSERAPQNMQSYDIPRWAMYDALYGGRKHPIIAPADYYTLVALACPCQLIFDVERGGRVDDPVLDKHPEATVRQDDFIHAQAVMPEFNVPEVLPEPMHAKWIGGSYDDGYCRLDADIHEEIRWFKGVYVDWNGVERQGADSTPGFDGKFRVGLRVEDSKTLSVSTLTLDRQIFQDDDGTIVFRVGFSDYKGQISDNVLHIVELAKNLVAADVERATRRVSSLGHSPKVKFALDTREVDVRLKVAGYSLARSLEMLFMSRLESFLKTKSWMALQEMSDIDNTIVPHPPLA